jgi:hypothetical protein
MSDDAQLRPDCDARLVGSSPHPCRPGGWWQLTAPHGRVFTFCSTVCLRALILAVNPLAGAGDAAPSGVA